MAGEDRKELDEMLESAVILANENKQYQSQLQNIGCSEPIISLMNNRNSDEEIKDECLKYLERLSRNRKTAPQIGKVHECSEGLIACIKNAVKKKNTKNKMS